MISLMISEKVEVCQWADMVLVGGMGMMLKGQRAV